MAAKPLPSVEFLRQCFGYDPETGVLTWRARPLEHFPTWRGWKFQNDRYAGRAAGSLQARSDGRGFYVGVNIDFVMRKAHRVIYAMAHGADPGDTVDHRDGDGTNNRLDNLRSASYSGNARNRKAQVEGQLKGATFYKHIAKWVAQIVVNKKHIYLGVFATQEEAHAAYCKAARELHGEFARFR